jgi:copper chaperone
MTDIQITSAPSTPAAAPAAAVTGPEQLADSPVVGVYSVHGMSCGHCVTAVTHELSAIEGVTGVHVNLAAKKVTVGSTRELTEDEVRAAVDEAGYELV